MTLSLRPRDAGEGAAGSAASPQAGSAAGTLAGTVTDAGDGSCALRLTHSLTTYPPIYSYLPDCYALVYTTYSLAY